MFESVLRRGGSFLKRVGTGLLRTVEFYNDLEIDRDEHESFSTEAVYVGLDDDVDEPARTNLEVLTPPLPTSEGHLMFLG